jgi:DNA-binding transcriptional regulator YiaG
MNHNMHMTLKEFVNKCGSQEKAARELGVTLRTVSNWLSGARRPRGLSKDALERSGVDHASCAIVEAKCGK